MQNGTKMARRLIIEDRYYICHFRSTSLLESSMLLNIQQPFSKLENTILIPASPDKVTLLLSDEYTQQGFTPVE